MEPPKRGSTAHMGEEMTIQKDTFDIAIMAFEEAHRLLKQRLFGKFKSKDANGFEAEFALEAGLFAYIRVPLSLHIWIASGRPADSWWEPYVCLTEHYLASDCGPDEILVKAERENAHLRDALLAAGYFEDTGRRVESAAGRCREIWRLTALFELKFDEVHQPKAQVTLADGSVSEPKVMKSQAGFYVGTTKTEDGYQVPCNRFSDYMSRSDAQKWLESAIANHQL